MGSSKKEEGNNEDSIVGSGGGVGDVKKFGLGHGLK